jgi:hypothetical protein
MNGFQAHLSRLFQLDAEALLLRRIYRNEGEVGAGIAEAIAAGLVRRSDLFITGKLWNTFHRREDVLRCGIFISVHF